MSSDNDPFDYAERLEKTLAEMGNSPGLVANCLRQLGIKGHQGSPCDCPIANYLKSLDYGMVVVSQIHIIAYAVGDWQNGDEELYIKTPANVKEFIIHFDNNEFPSLIA